MIPARRLRDSIVIDVSIWLKGKAALFIKHISTAIQSALWAKKNITAILKTTSNKDKNKFTN